MEISTFTSDLVNKSRLKLLKYTVTNKNFFKIHYL